MIAAAALITSIWIIMRKNASMGATYGVTIAVVLYGLIVLGSDIFHRFAVSARHVRAIAPFFVWVTGAVLAWMATKGKQGLAVSSAVCALMLVFGARNFIGPLQQIFPRNFINVARAMIVSDREKGGGLQPLRFMNDHFLNFPAVVLPTPVDAQLFWSCPHPFDYAPYLFEGYSEAYRQAYLERDRSMKILKFKGVKPIQGFPFAFKMSYSPELSYNSDRPEPILASGVCGSGDLIFVKYLPGKCAQVGLDHWGAVAPVSQPFQYERGLEHTWVVIAPCLFSNDSSDEVVRRRTERWSHRVYVSVDSAPILDIGAEFYPSSKNSVTVGLNLIGSTGAVVSLNMRQASFSALNDADWAKAESGR